MRTSSRFLASLLVAVAFARPDTVLAAFNGSIDSTSGRPGDRVTVVSTDTGPLVVGATGLYLMPAIDPNRPERSINCANELGSYFLGAFEQVGSTARLLFDVPAVTPGAYEVRMDVPSASPSCWRLWAFEVLAAMPATDRSPTATPFRSSVSVAMVVGTVAGCGLLVWLSSRERGNTRAR